MTTRSEMQNQNLDLIMSFEIKVHEKLLRANVFRSVYLTRTRVGSRGSALRLQRCTFYRRDNTVVRARESRPGDRQEMIRPNWFVIKIRHKDVSL